MSIPFVRMATRKLFLTLEFPPLHMTMKNRFGYHKIDDGNFLVTIGLTTKFFWLPMDWPKNFNRQSEGDQNMLVTNFSVAIPKVIKTCQLLIFLFPSIVNKGWWLKPIHFKFRSSNQWWIDLHHWFGHKIFLCLVIKIKPCNLNSLSPLRCVGLVLFNKQSLPYTLRGRGETSMGVWSFKTSYYIYNWCWISIVAL